MADARSVDRETRKPWRQSVRLTRHLQRLPGVSDFSRSIVKPA